MDIDNLENLIKKYKWPDYRKKQAITNVYKKFITSWDEASDLPSDLRTALKEEIPINTAKCIKEDISDKGSTVKTLFALEDGQKIESVLLHYQNGRNTVCVSSQVGCPMNCLFCATGQMGFKRNLNDFEIVDQILYFNQSFRNLGLDERVNNIVFMGMGEPLLNYENVLRAIRMINDKDKFNIGARKISISTCGIIPGIEKLLKEKLQVNLAISLHSADEKKRSRIMPVNKRYPLSKLINVVNNYADLSKRKVFFEYILLRDVNDSIDDAKKLVALMKINRLFHVNLIKYHETGKFKSSTELQKGTFFDYLKQNKINATVRKSFGEDIKGACGQLAIDKG